MKSFPVYALLFAIAFFCATPCMSQGMSQGTSQSSIPQKWAKKCEKTLRTVVSWGKYGEYGYRYVPGYPNDNPKYEWMLKYMEEKGYVVLDEGRYFGAWTVDFWELDSIEDWIFRKYYSTNYYSLNFKDGHYNAQTPSGKIVSCPIKWSGEINEGGGISGKGYGIHKEGDYILIVKGNFSWGFPVGGNSGTAYQIKNTGNHGIKKTDMEISIPGEVSSCIFGENCTESVKEEAWKHYKDVGYKSSWNRMNDILEDMISNISKDPDYYKKNLYTVYPVTYKDVDKAATNYINFCDKTNYDPDNGVKIANEIIYIKKIADAFDLNWDWEKRDTPPSREPITQGISYAKNGIVNGFNDEVKDFYKTQLALLEKADKEYPAKEKDFLKKRELYLIRKRQEADEARRKAEQRSIQDRGEIDWSRSKKPSGDLSHEGVIFYTGYCYSKDGILYTKAGKSCTYNIWYNDDKEFKYYYVVYCSEKMEGREFESLEELTNAFLRAVR